MDEIKTTSLDKNSEVFLSFRYFWIAVPTSPLPPVTKTPTLCVFFAVVISVAFLLTKLVRVFILLNIGYTVSLSILEDNVLYVFASSKLEEGSTNKYSP